MCTPHCTTGSLSSHYKLLCVTHCTTGSPSSHYTLLCVHPTVLLVPHHLITSCCDEYTPLYYWFPILSLHTAMCTPYCTTGSHPLITSCYVYTPLYYWFLSSHYTLLCVHPTVLLVPILSLQAAMCTLHCTTGSSSSHYMWLCVHPTVLLVPHPLITHCYVYIPLYYWFPSSHYKVVCVHPTVLLVPHYLIISYYEYTPLYYWFPIISLQAAMSTPHCTTGSPSFHYKLLCVHPTVLLVLFHHPTITHPTII